MYCNLYDQHSRHIASTVSQRWNVTGSSHRQKAGHVRHDCKAVRQNVTYHQHTKGKFNHRTLAGRGRCAEARGCALQGGVRIREGDAGGRLVRPEGVDTSKHYHRASNGYEHEEEEEAVGYAEYGKWEVVVIFDPVIEAAEAASGNREDTHENTEYYSTMERPAIP